MAEYVQILPDSTGQKIAVEVLQQDADTIATQIVKLADGRDLLIAETLVQILEEMRELRLVVCAATNQPFNEL